MYTARPPREDEDKGQSDAFKKAKECQRITSKPPEARKEAWNIILSQGSEKTYSAHTNNLDF